MRHLASVTRMRQLTVFLAALSLSGFLSVTSPKAGDTFAIVDTLGSATPSTQFSVFGSSGLSIFTRQFVGPRFTLTQQTVLTEIGGFVNNCREIVLGVPQCPVTLPFIVEIHPELNGIPDPSHVLATFVLSHDDDPLVISYESVVPNFSLGPGTYFALFGSQNDDAGFILGVAGAGSYRAGLTPAGVLDPTTGSSSASAGETMAVRILGQVPTAAELLRSLATAVTGIGPGTSLADKVAEAETLLAENDVAGTCSKLTAFVHEVKAQSGKSIAADQAATLIGSARRIKTMLGC
jgi:hypothetical protein